MHSPNKLSRRALIQSGCAYAAHAALAAAGISLIGGAALAQAQEFAADRQTVENWMEEWMAGDKALDGPLHVSRFVEPIYFLTRPISWIPNQGQEKYQAVTVPVGFVTDFASIPRVFWSALRPDGKYTYAAIVHDFLYWTQTRPKDEADLILKFGMQDLEVGALTTKAIYEAVSLFGGSAWNGNAKLKANGEKRILKRFPDDPRTSWENWKKLPDVFE